MKWWRLERDLAARRVAWFDTPAGRAALTPRPTPRQAFETLFFAYMGLAAAEVPVVDESADAIVWESKNPCPTLEACAMSGRDTRKVCRAVTERPTQHFLSRLDPELRFQRDYGRIRPHAPHCRESIVRVSFDSMMEVALAEAAQSLAEGNKGYGAVVAMGREILAQTHDTAATEGDPSAHAEMKALRLAAKRLGRSDLCGAVLYSTCEPCPMCAGMAAWCNVTSVVYGASIAETMALGRSRIAVEAAYLLERAPALVEVVGGVLGERCLELYRS